MLDLVEKLRALPTGWDGDGAEPPNETAIANARRAVDISQQMDFRPSRIAASVEGGVMVSFFVGKRYGDMELFNTGEILAVTSDGTGSPKIWEVADAEAAMREALERIRAWITTPAAPPDPAEGTAELTDKQKGLLALLASWKEEDHTDDPEELARRDREITEFKNNMNQWRAEEGRGPVYP